MPEQYCDHQGCQENKEIVDQLESEERIIFSILVVKKNNWGIKQDRTMLVTNSHYYNIEDNKIKRKVDIKDIMAFTVSMNCNDFILHVHNEYDY